MNKPFIIIKNELENNIIQAINNSGLDLGIVELIMKDIVNNISRIAQENGERQCAMWKAEDDIKISEIKEDNGMIDNQDVYERPQDNPVEEVE